MPNTSDKIWYVRKGIKKLGPFSNAEMLGLASSGKLVPEDMIWKDGLADWVKAAKLKGVFPVQTKIEEASPPPAESEPESSNQQSGTPNGSILLITTIIALVVAVVGGGGLIIFTGQMKSPAPSIHATNSGEAKTDDSTEVLPESLKPRINSGEAKTDDSTEVLPESLKPTKILGVRLGDKISTYKVLKVDKNEKNGDKYYIDPSAFDRPGTMGLYTWEYVAKVNIKEEVYEVECVLPQQTFSIIAKEGEPKGPGLDLFPAIRAVYPKADSINPIEFSVEAKDGYNISLKAKQYRRGLEIDLVWEANVRIYHPETSMKLFQERMDKERKDVLKKNEGF